MAVKHKIGGNSFEFLKGIVKSSINRIFSLSLIHIIDNRFAFIDDLHTYVHAVELHYHHFTLKLHRQNDYKLFTYRMVM